MNIQAAIAQVVAGQSLSRADMETVMRTVMQGEATEAQVGGLLVGLRMKGETIDEIVGAASVMRSRNSLFNLIFCIGFSFIT